MRIGLNLAKCVKTPTMGKTVDKFGVCLIGALLSFLLFYRLTRSIVAAAIASILACSTVVLFVRLIKPREPKNRIGKRNFIRYVLLNGNDTLKKAIEASFEGRFQTEEVDGHTVLDTKERTLVYYTYKFGSLSEEDVAKSYRLAEKTGCKAIYALTNHLDRKAIAVTEYIPQKFTVIGAAAIYKYLSKRGLLPPKEALSRKKGKRLSALKAAFTAANAKYFVWAGLTTSAIALFTPLTAYYIVFSFVNLILAVTCMLLSEKSEGRNELFKE